jgi:hypothetical protein
MHDQAAISQLHYELIHGFLTRGTCPTNDELATSMDVALGEVEERLRALSDIHGVVLHPHISAPWVVHPFSTTPTLNWLEGKHGGWWAPCVWCALGIATLTGGETCIHTRYGAEEKAVAILIADGQPIGHDDACVHFAIPPARAWENVHEHCSLVLVFQSADEVGKWCERHRLPRGQVVPLRQVVRLAKIWYGTYASPDWHKWSISEAQAIFNEAGLQSDFWNLGEGSGNY